VIPVTQATKHTLNVLTFYYLPLLAATQHKRGMHTGALCMHLFSANFSMWKSKPVITLTSQAKN
jgi:hypothetical protein